MATTRINLGNGKWFNPESSESFAEDTRWDGHNHISVPTGSQWDHEELYRTRGGTWILHSWSQWQGSRSSYEVIDAARALRWLIDNNRHEDAERLFPRAVEAAEV